MRSVSVPPSRSNVRSSSTRSSFACIAGSERRDFVEHDRAALGHLEPSRLARDGAGERSALVAEKFGFDELGGQAGAIDLQERRVAARAAFVNPARELILARAAFAGDQQRSRRLGKFFRDFEDAPRGRISRNPGNVRGAHGCAASPSDSSRDSEGLRGRREIEALGAAPEPFEIVVFAARVR